MARMDRKNRETIVFTSIDNLIEFGMDLQDGREHVEIRKFQECNFVSSAAYIYLAVIDSCHPLIGIVLSSNRDLERPRKCRLINEFRR